LVLAFGLAPPAKALGALPLAFALGEDKGASGSAVAVLTAFVASAGVGADVAGFVFFGVAITGAGLSGTE
jgi:hypothetical protein